METNKNSLENNQQQSSEENTQKGRQEQVELSNTSHRQGQDAEDEEDINSMKGKTDDSGNRTNS